jgi:putative ABC transport system permease protein
MLAGRAFRPADVAPNSQVAIVDQGFVDQILEGRNPIGQRVRFVNRSAGAGEPPEPWVEVVGVVKELGMGSPVEVGRAAGFYLPARPELLAPAYMMVHVKGDPLALAPQLREIAAAVNPMLRLSELQRLDEVNGPLLWFMGLWIKITVLMSAVALLLSLAGIYAVLSFTVSRRTREIGLRVAVGASRLQVVTAIFRRPLWQVGLGILAGGALIVAGGNIQTEMPGLTGDLSLKQYGIIVAYATFMLAVCLLACVVPTRRALDVEPTIALRAD